MSNASLVQQLVYDIAQLNPRQKHFLEKSIQEISSLEMSELEAYIGEQLDKGLGLSDLAEAYNRIVVDTLAEQIYFKKEGRYRFSKFVQVAEGVYHDPRYMKEYMIGLALTQYLWSNHRILYQFFCESIRESKGRSYLEIGTGHGLHFGFAVQNGDFDSYLAVDLSETSIQLTEKRIEKITHEKDVVIKLADFLSFDSQTKFDFIAMGEVLEHVEEPQIFMAKLKELLAPKGRVFISTCCNAPAIDHIYLFNNVDEVVDLCRNAGFQISSECVVPHPGLTLNEAEEKKYPVNLALVLNHA